MIYDLDIPILEAKASVRQHFYEQAHLKDARVREMLVEQGYISL